MAFEILSKSSEMDLDPIRASSEFYILKNRELLCWAQSVAALSGFTYFQHQASLFSLASFLMHPFGACIKERWLLGFLQVLLQIFVESVQEM